MLREQYIKLCDQIDPDPNLVESVIAQAADLEQKQKTASCQKRQTYLVYLRKTVLALTAAALCLFMGIPALAANAEPVYRLMYLVSPAIAQRFMPVRELDEDNGIKMEVVSASIHGSTAEVYITMQDLAGDRIDGTIDLFDSYRINRPFDCTCHCEQVGYEERTKTATFLITIEGWGGQDISGDKFTFSVREFLSRRKNYDQIRIPADLSGISQAVHTQTVSVSGGSAQDDTLITDMLFRQDPKALVPGEPLPEFPVDGIDLTGIGYIDGKLHVQMVVGDLSKQDNHGSFVLRSLLDDREMQSSYCFYFTDRNEQAGRMDYCETVFEISPEKLADYALYGDFVTTGMRTEGNWSVTFALEE